MKSKTLVLESGKCSHSGCVFCGYAKEKPVLVDSVILKAKTDQALFEPTDELKIFSSGSFLDEKQFPREFRQYLAKKCREKNIKLIIESRPEFVTDETLSDFKGINLSVAIGLEVADNDTLKKINKGFTIEDFIKASETLHRNNFKLRAYVLVNPPFVKDIRKSLMKTVEFAKKHSDSIVIINMLPHYKAPLFYLWLKGQWHPINKKQFHDLTKNIEDVEKDPETFRFTPRFPNKEKKFWRGVGGECLENPHYRVWQEYISDWYEVPENKEIALFLPCSYKKPYSKSKTHTLIYQTLKKIPNKKKIHRIVISSPGVIPFEFNNKYPFNAYDWDESLETPEIKKEYIRVNKQRVKNYLKNHKYEKILCFYKPSSESYAALAKACEELGLELTNCIKEDMPLHSEKALEQLKSTILA